MPYFRLLWPAFDCCTRQLTPSHMALFCFWTPQPTPFPTTCFRCKWMERKGDAFVEPEINPVHLNSLKATTSVCIRCYALYYAQWLSSRTNLERLFDQFLPYEISFPLSIEHESQGYGGREIVNASFYFSVTQPNLYTQSVYIEPGYLQFYVMDAMNVWIRQFLFPPDPYRQCVDPFAIPSTRFQFHALNEPNPYDRNLQSIE